LEFNVSHSSDAAAFAFSRAGAAGVDIEAIRSVAHGGLAERFFAPADAQTLCAGPVGSSDVGALAGRSVPHLIRCLACEAFHQRGGAARSRYWSQ
jgi:hypothetical protein